MPGMEFQLILRIVRKNLSKARVFTQHFYMNQFYVFWFLWFCYACLKNKKDQMDWSFGFIWDYIPVLELSWNQYELMMQP